MTEKDGLGYTPITEEEWTRFGFDKITEKHEELMNQARLYRIYYACKGDKEVEEIKAMNDLEVADALFDMGINPERAAEVVLKLLIEALTEGSQKVGA